MKLKIFNSILRGDLRPWKNQRTEKYYHQVMTKPFFQPQNSMDEFFAVLKKIFSENPALLKDEMLTVYLQQPPGKLVFNITEPLIEIDLPEPFDITSRFYCYLIKNETTRTTANLFNAITCDLDDTDRHYLINSLRSGVIDKLRDLAEIKSDLQDDQLSAYVLDVLKWSLIRLLLETDKLYPQFVDPIPATDSEIFAEYLSEPVPEFDYINSTVKVDQLREQLQEVLNHEDKPKKTKPTLTANEDFSFGFTGDRKKLENVIKQLNLKVELLKDGQTTPEELLHVLTAKSLTSTAPEIHLDCETTQFRYIIDRLEPYFTNLKPSTIDKAGIFYSKKNTRINKQNLYSNKIASPKNQPIIDDILKELQ